MKRRTIYFLFSFCVIITLCGCNTPEPTSDIANYLEDLNAEEGFSGVVLIAKDGEQILEKAYGIANRNYDVPNQLDTKFNLGSMNKMFTAVAILQLVEQGKISVDDKVIEHLPGYPNKEVAEDVTIHQLLTHTSGMGEYLTHEWRVTSNDRFKEIDDYLPLFVDKPLQFEPGSRGSYSNAGYIVLGMIIEETSGKTYFDYVMENIYQPCGMSETDSFEVDRVVSNIAIGYENFRSNLYRLPFKGSSAGGGYSTVGDMLKFSSCLVNHQLLSPELTEILLEGKVQSPIPGISGNYAYGFIDSVMNDHRIVGHGGRLPGFCSNLDIFIDNGYTVVILSNSTHDCNRVISKTRETLLH